MSQRNAYNGGEGEDSMGGGLRVRLSRWRWPAMVGAVLGVSLGWTAHAAEIVIYAFEHGLEGWVIPDWAKTSTDYVGKALDISTEVAEEGSSALKLDTEFPGQRWTGAYVEREVEVTDWGQFGQVAVGVYVPADAPQNLTGRIILTVGETWQWTEMNRGIPLLPGQWTTLSANLKPGSMDWKFFPDESFRKDVRKLGIRIESDKQPGDAGPDYHRPPYRGPVFVDNVRLSE